jgi:hypothetical protein
MICQISLKTLKIGIAFSVTALASFCSLIVDVEKKKASRGSLSFPLRVDLVAGQLQPEYQHLLLLFPPTPLPSYLIPSSSLTQHVLAFFCFETTIMASESHYEYRPITEPDNIPLIELQPS